MYIREGLEIELEIVPVNWFAYRNLKKCLLKSLEFLVNI